MQRKRINTGKVGLVFRNGDYKRVLTEGTWWISPFEELVQYNMTRPFHSAISLNILLRDEKLAEMLEVVEVQDHEIALQYEDGKFQTVLTVGKYAFWKGVINYTFTKADLNKVEITEKVEKSVLERREVLPYIRVYVVESYERGVLYIDGKFEKILANGTYIFWKNSTPVKVDKVDLRQLQLELVGQDILTKDKAALRVNFVAQYKVVDIEKAMIVNKDFEKQLYTITQLALREFIGTFTLDELLENKESVGGFVMKSLASKAKALGVEVMDCGVRDIILPGEVKEIMNQVLVAQKQAQANVIMRREETASTRSLLNTAQLMESNEMLFKLKEMEYVEKIADKIGEITVSGNGQVLDQLKSIFAPTK
ncbi:slipin family protein [Marivirga sp. S37H4]|uniref:Slipin family protein n=1 Tax=Marivirga aurantiaca TaxID=2802615 RepID=A0A935C6H4_9BACT|nr:slipin family protein [Marivirga aurantiaca]MBK6264370.1 slipin family protein [Marivirga aurantiaca]